VQSASAVTRAFFVAANRSTAFGRQQTAGSFSLRPRSAVRFPKILKKQKSHPIGWDFAFGDPWGNSTGAIFVCDKNKGTAFGRQQPTGLLDRLYRFPRIILKTRKPPDWVVFFW
jgi:hypothetical protein